MTESAVRIGRVYEPVQPEDGHRILVDRLWPRGMRRGDPRVGEWMKDAAPSTDLRKWYGHVPERFDEFRTRYEQELSAGDAQQAVLRIRELAVRGTVTLLTATKDLDHSEVPILAEVVSQQPGRTAIDG